MHPMDEEGVDDMATLAELHGGAIMHNLHQRYKRDQIYVSATCIPLGKKKNISLKLGSMFVCLQRVLPAF